MSPLVSILINNYNYATFLPEAIESAIRQTYVPIEIIVVDDGSTDGSRDVIEGVRNSVIPVFKNNGGQASAFNAGIERSRGDIVCFLDADDVFLPEKVADVVEVFERENGHSKPMMVHHPLEIVDEATGQLSGALIGKTHGLPINLFRFASRYGFVEYEAAPTTGVSINRLLASILFPLPERGLRVSADDFIVKGASLVGELHSIDRALGRYRVHGSNAWFSAARRKPRVFVEALDAYLNEILVRTGHPPVMSFYDSIDYSTDLALAGHCRKLIWHLIKLSARRRNPRTLRYALRMLRLSLTPRLSASDR
jgi:glycosyltransferase involved in cell wall biosynthesis